MKTIKGPAIFLAQFAGDAAPFNSLRLDLRMGGGARLQGRADPDLGRAPVRSDKAANSRPIATRSTESRPARVEITELSTHLQGQLVAVHPAYDAAFDGFAAPEVRGNPRPAPNGRSTR